jgi:hypothetical protein
MTVEAIAAEILRDRETRISKPTNAGDTPCFKCGKLFECRGARGDNSGRFCSDHCRAEYDLPGAFSFDPFKVTKWKVVAGGDPGYLVATPMTRISGGGWRVRCRGCGRLFESSGLAYCKPTCRQASAERAEAANLMAEIGMDAPPSKRPCQAPGCTGTIPRWRNGRQVSKRAKYCDRHS